MSKKKKVITYGTYDLLHYGHIRLLERAKALGDYLIVGVTSDDFDKTRGKINVQQSLMERLEAVKATGIADEVIVEEYEGQKIDDIRRMDVDIFTVGSDWVGKFDYLNEFCEVVYLPRTEGVSSSEIRNTNRKIRMGILCEKVMPRKIVEEASFVNGVDIAMAYMENGDNSQDSIYVGENRVALSNSVSELMDNVDAVFVFCHPKKRYETIMRAIESGVHVLSESPIALDPQECENLFSYAKKNNCVLVDGIKTAYATAYERILLMVRDGRIGDILSVDSTCTSLADSSYGNEDKQVHDWNSIFTWGPIGLLPVFQILGEDYKSKRIVTRFLDDEKKYDAYTKIDFVFDHATASVRVAKGAKAEGSLVITGTKGYIYVPAPWWKTDYFEVRYENQEMNKKYFYQLDGEGIRYEMVAFAKSIASKQVNLYMDNEISIAISGIMKDFVNRVDLIEI